MCLTGVAVSGMMLSMYQAVSGHVHDRRSFSDHCHGVIDVEPRLMLSIVRRRAVSPWWVWIL